MKKIMLRLILALVVLFVVVLAAIPHFIMGDLLNQRMEVEELPLTELEAIQVMLSTEDNLSISAWEVVAENSKGTVIILSGIEKPSVTAFKGYSKLLKDNGYSSLLIEMRAHGRSEGDRVALGMEEYLDVKAGVDYILNENSDQSVIVWGTSMGASSAITSIGRIDEIDGVISCSAYSSWTDVFGDHLAAMGVPNIIVSLERPFIDLYVGIKYGFSKLEISPINEIANLKGRPILLAHSTEDSQIPFSSFERLLERSEGENVHTFVRQGDEHFICYDENFDQPENDKVFSETVLNFLSENFN